MRSHRFSRVAVAGAVCCALVGLGGVVELLVASTASAQSAAPADDPALLKALTERALGDNGGGSVQLQPGRLPEEFPSSAIPAGWKLIGSVSRQFPSPTGTNFKTVQVFWDAPGQAPAAQAALVAGLTAQGWKSFSFSPTPQGGFTPSPIAVPSQLCNSGGTVVGIATSNERQAGTTAVSVSLSSLPTGVSSPCNPGNVSGSPVTTAIAQAPLAYSNAPALTFPSGAKALQVGGNGGSPWSFTSTALIESALSISELDKHFAGLITSAGWTRVSGAGDGQIAISGWRKTVGDVSMQLVLTVATTTGGDNRRDLVLNVTMPPSANGPGLFFGPTQAPPVPVIAPPGVPTTDALASAPQAAAGFGGAGVSATTAPKKATTRPKVPVTVKPTAKKTPAKKASK
jgi:hypothetical protein